MHYMDSPRNSVPVASLPLPDTSIPTGPKITGKDIARALDLHQELTSDDSSGVNNFLDLLLSRSSCEPVLWPPGVSWAGHTPCGICMRPSSTLLQGLGYILGDTQYHSPLLSVPDGLVRATGLWPMVSWPWARRFLCCREGHGLMWIEFELFHLLMDLGLFCLYNETDMSDSFGFLLMI